MTMKRTDGKPLVSMNKRTQKSGRKAGTVRFVITMEHPEDVAIAHDVLGHMLAGTHNTENHDQEVAYTGNDDNERWPFGESPLSWLNGGKEYQRPRTNAENIAHIADLERRLFERDEERARRDAERDAVNAALLARLEALEGAAAKVAKPKRTTRRK